MFQKVLEKFTEIQKKKFIVKVAQDFLIVSTTTIICSKLIANILTTKIYVLIINKYIFTFIYIGVELRKFTMVLNI